MMNPWYERNDEEQEQEQEVVLNFVPAAGTAVTLVYLVLKLLIDIFESHVAGPKSAFFCRP